MPAGINIKTAGVNIQPRGINIQPSVRPALTLIWLNVHSLNTLLISLRTAHHSFFGTGTFWHAVTCRVYAHQA